MIAYKLFRKKKNGRLTSLFINKSREYNFGEWMDAESFPTKGFFVRPYWHCTSEMSAPHLTLKGRVWVEVEIEDYIEDNRPMAQGSVWYLAKKLKMIREI